MIVRPRIRSGLGGRAAAEVGLGATLAFSVVVPPELYSVLGMSALAMLLIQARGLLPVRYVVIALPWLALPGLGFLGAPGNQAYDIARDFWRFATPPLYLLIGLMLSGRIALASGVRAAVYGAIGVALVHLSSFILHPQILFLSDVRAIRAVAGKGYTLAAIGLGLIIAGPRFGMRVVPGRLPGLRAVALCILTASVVLSFSRTLLATTVLVLVTMTGALYGLNRRTVVVGLLGAVAVGLLLVLAGPLRDSGTGLKDSFLEKLLVSAREIAITSRTQGQGEIHAFWRGYEAYRAVLTFLEGSAREYVHGRGFGTLVDVGFTLNLGGTDFRYVPLTHNGYTYVLVKTGIAGIILYVAFAVWVVRLGASFRRSVVRELALGGHVAAGLGYTILFTTLVITGVYNYNDLIGPVIVLGLLLGALTNPTIRPLGSSVPPSQTVRLAKQDA